MGGRTHIYTLFTPPQTLYHKHFPMTIRTAALSAALCLVVAVAQSPGNGISKSTYVQCRMTM